MEGDKVDLILLDFSKTFDTVSYYCKNKIF